jgi:hypothetical protein
MANIRFTPAAKRLFWNVESYGWKRCKPRINEFDLYMQKFHALQNRRVFPDQDRLVAAVDRVKKDLAPFAVGVTTLSKSFWKLKKPTSCGLSLDENGEFRKLFSTKEDTPYWSIVSEVKRWKKKGFIDTPSTITFRSHLARKEAHKTRVAFVYPYSVCALEGKYAIPLLEALKNSSYSSPFGTQHNWLRGGLRHFKSYMRRGIPLSVDSSGFDLSARRFLIEIAFELAHSCFRLNQEQEDEWTMFVEYFINTIIRNGGRNMILRGGIPSGSVWTHIIGTIISLILAYYSVPDLLTVKAFGDDLVIMCSSQPNVAAIANHFSSLGFELSRDKTVLGEIHWLGFNITGPYPEVLDVVKRWAAFFHPERSDESMAYHKGRLMSYAIASLGDPLFLRDFYVLWHELRDYNCILDGMNYIVGSEDTDVSTIAGLQRVLRNVN